MGRLHKGTTATRDFYDRVGWRRQDGILVDTLLFGGSQNGAIHQQLKEQREERLRQAAGGRGCDWLNLGAAVHPLYFLPNSARHTLR